MPRPPEGLNDPDFINSFPGDKIGFRKLGRRVKAAPSEYRFFYWGRSWAGDLPNLPSIETNGIAYVLRKVAIQHKECDSYLEAAYLGTEQNAWDVTFRRWRVDMPEREKRLTWQPQLFELVLRSRAQRPEWSGTWESPEHFNRVVGALVQAIFKTGKNPTAKRIREWLEGDGYGYVWPSQFTDWLHKAGWTTFKEFKDAFLKK